MHALAPEVRIVAVVLLDAAGSFLLQDGMQVLPATLTRQIGVVSRRHDRDRFRRAVE